MYIVASLAAAAAVINAGTIGFIGLVVPHVLRLVFGNDQRMLLPALALVGGLAVMVADLIAHTVIAPAQLPVGVITVLIGVPVFLWMLPQARAMKGLEVMHLTLRAGSRVLIADLTQTFAPGEMWCVAGPNGAGKTTLIAVMAGGIEDSIEGDFPRWKGFERLGCERTCPPSRVEAASLA